MYKIIFNLSKHDGLKQPQFLVYFMILWVEGQARTGWVKFLHDVDDGHSVVFGGWAGSNKRDGGVANEPGGKAGAYKIAEDKEREEGMSNTEQKSTLQEISPLRNMVDEGCI